MSEEKVALAEMEKRLLQLTLDYKRVCENLLTLEAVTDIVDNKLLENIPEDLPAEEAMDLAKKRFETEKGVIHEQILTLRVTLFAHSCIIMDGIKNDIVAEAAKAVKESLKASLQI